MDLWESFLLGLIQGITEFLPISSSGHLVLGQYFLGIQNDGGITFEIVVHFGSLVSIVLYYRKDVLALIISALELIRKPKLLLKPTEMSKDQQVVGLILVSMIPALLVGVLLKSSIESAFESPIWVSAMLMITGTLLLSTKYAPKGTQALGLKQSVGMGLAQAVAILPGISRSGSTIAIGQHLGMSREECARFSFLMVIPVIAGAMILEMAELGNTGGNVDLPILTVGFLTSAISGYFALTFLIHIIKKFGIQWFAAYCYVLGSFSLWYFLT
jgi:undecaprenyl-diphosphatase